MLYDDNHIQLDGPTAMAWSEDVLAALRCLRLAHPAGRGRQRPRRHRGGDRDRPSDERPSLIAVRTHIGFGSPNKHDSQKAHGSPLGPEEVRLTKEAYGWDPDRSSTSRMRPATTSATRSRPVRRWSRDWDARFDAYARGLSRAARPSSAAGSTGRPAGRLGRGPQDVRDRHRGRHPQRSQDAIQALAGPLPELFGGAADLSESNLTDVKGEPNFEADEPGRNLRFGVREHAMGGITNGIAYHGGFIPYCATFLTFSDYMRGSVRLAALSGLHLVYVWTHDSVGLGEDGPTHQPVEHYAALRAIPNLSFVRPGDANETAAAWALAIEQRDGPVALALTRQKLPTLRGHGPARPRGRRPRRLRPARGRPAARRT